MKTIYYFKNYLFNDSLHINIDKAVEQDDGTIILESREIHYPTNLIINSFPSEEVNSIIYKENHNTPFGFQYSESRVDISQITVRDAGDRYALWWYDHARATTLSYVLVDKNILDVSENECK